MHPGTPGYFTDGELRRPGFREHVQSCRNGQPVPDGVHARRSALLDAKLAAGRAATEERLARQIALSDRVTRAIARASGGRRRLSQIELLVPGVKAEALPAWYFERALADDEAEFLRACPGHHLFRPAPGGLGQEVWETTGGSPIASRFFITLGETDGVLTPADPSYPVQMVGVARLADGTAIGAIRHQFRDETDGARALLEQLTDPAVIRVQVDVAAAQDRDDVPAGEAVAVFQDRRDAERG